MRTFLYAVAALASGMAIGAWQPRGELLAARAELIELRGQPCRRSAADRVRSLLTADRPERITPSRAAPPSTEPDVPGAAEPSPEPELPEAEAPDAAPDDAPDPEETAELLQDALAARRSQARQALREQGELDDAQMEEVDRIMDDMNRKLKAEIDAFAEDAEERGTVERRDMMEIAAVSLDIFIAADDRLVEVLPDPEAIPEEVRDPFSFIDPATVEGLTRLERFVDPEDE